MTCQQPLVKQARVECSHWRLLAETAVWLTVGREVTVALLQGQYANVIMNKKMRHEQAILLVSISKLTAHYFSCQLTIGVIKSSLSQDLGQRRFHVRELVLPYTNLHDSVESFSCPTISKIPETCPLIVHVCFVLLIVCIYVCVCECLLQNNNHKKQHIKIILIAGVPKSQAAPV